MVCSRRSAIAALLMSASGCNLFRSVGTEDSVLTSLFPRGKDPDSGGGATGPVLSLVRLEANIASRPIGDPKIRRLVWEELDESGLMTPEQRRTLNESGFRIGVAGSSTPWALQSLVRDASAARRTEDESQSSSALDAVPGALGPSFTLMQNGQSYLEIQSQLDESRLPLARIPQLAALRDRQGLRCVFELSAREIADDWVLLNILPIVFSGTSTLRLTIQDNTAKLPVRQNTIPLYEHQVTVRLLAGEVAVIGRYAAAGSDNWNLGNLFFAPDEGSSATERILMIGMSGIEKLRGQSDPTFRLGAYSK